MARADLQAPADVNQLMSALRIAKITPKSVKILRRRVEAEKCPVEGVVAAPAEEAPARRMGRDLAGREDVRIRKNAVRIVRNIRRNVRILRRPPEAEGVVADLAGRAGMCKQTARRKAPLRHLYVPKTAESPNLVLRPRILMNARQKGTERRFSMAAYAKVIYHARMLQIRCAEMTGIRG